MRQGTTPKHTFILPFDTNIVQKVRVAYAQRGTVKIKKTEADVELNGDQIVVTLTQGDTLRLNDKTKADIQVKVLTSGGDTFVSDIISVSVKRCLCGEVL